LQEISGNLSIIQLFMRVPEIDARKQKPKLLMANLGGLGLVGWPGKPIPLQSLQPEAKAVSIPIDDLQEPPGLIAEKKQVPFKRILPELFGNDQRQPVDLFSHISDPRFHENPDLTPIYDHFRPSMTLTVSQSNARPAESFISIRYLPTVTAMPAFEV
jgi:hypothetical protein